MIVIFVGGDDDLLVAPITSQNARSERDVNLTQWQKAGLRLPSIIRLEKLATLEKSTVIRRLGQIAPNEWSTIKPVLSQFFADILELGVN